MKPAYLLSLALLAPWNLALAQEGEKYALGLTAQKGTKATFTMHSKTTQELDMGGQQMTMGHDVQRVFTIEVVDVGKDGKLKLKVLWESSSGKVLLPMGSEVEFDTAKPAEAEEGGDDGMGMPSAGQVQKFVGAIMGKTLEATVSTTGQDLEIAGLKELAEGAAKKLSGMGGSMLMGMLNEGLLRKDIDCALCRYPNEPTAVGGTWKTEFKEAGRRNRPGMRTEGKLQLDKADKETFVISLAGALLKDEPKAEGKEEGKEEGKQEDNEDPQAEMARQMMKGMKVSNGKVEGTATISRKDGMAIKSVSKMSADLAMPSPMGGDSEMKIAQTSTLTCERGAPKPAEKAAPTEKKGEKQEAGAKK